MKKWRKVRWTDCSQLCVVIANSNSRVGFKTKKCGVCVAVHVAMMIIEITANTAQYPTVVEMEEKVHEFASIYAAQKDGTQDCTRSIIFMSKIFMLLNPFFIQPHPHWQPVELVVSACGKEAKKQS